MASQRDGAEPVKTRKKQIAPACTERPRRRIVYAPLTFSEHDGVRYLHFGTDWIQGAMRLSRPDRIELEYAQQMMAWMLFIHAPRHVVQLGLGAASLTKFCYRQFVDAEVTAVELNPGVITAARSMFRLPPDDDRLRVIEGDALAFVEDAAHHGGIDALQVDLYDATARGPVLDSIEFYAACRACLRGPGMMTANLFGDHSSFGRNIKAIGAAFKGRVLALPEVHAGNRVALAFNGPSLDVAWSDLYDRAAAIEAATRLPARSWLHGIKEEANAASKSVATRRLRI